MGSEGFLKHLGISDDNKDSESIGGGYGETHNPHPYFDSDNNQKLDLELGVNPFESLMGNSKVPSVELNSKDFEDEYVDLTELYLRDNSELIQIDIDEGLTKSDIGESIIEDLNILKQQAGLTTTPKTDISEINNIISEINEFKNTKSNLDKIQFNDLSNEVKNYKNKKYDGPKSFDAVPYNILDLVGVNSDLPNEEINALYELVNLELNINNVEDELSIRLNKLLGYANEEAEVLTGEGDALIKDIVNNKENKIKELKKIYASEVDNIKQFKSLTINKLNSIVDSEVQNALTEHKELMDYSNSINFEVSEIIGKVKTSLGEKYLDRLPKVDINYPDTKEDLESIIEKVEDNALNVKIDESNRFSKIASKSMDLIFFMAKFAPKEYKTHATIANVILFIYLAVKFKSYFVIGFTSLILIEGFIQLKLFKQNRGVKYLEAYNTNYSEMINHYKGGISRKARSEAELKIKPVLDMLNEICNSLEESLSNKLSSKISVVETKLKDSSISTEVVEHMELIEGFVSKIKAQIINQFDEVQTAEVNKILNKIEEKKLILQDANNLDVYSNYNRRSKLFDGEIKIGRYTSNNYQDYGSDYSVKFEEGSYLIRVKNKEEKERAMDKLKLYLIQLLSNISPEIVTINFYDIAEMGNDFMEMIVDNEMITKLYSSEESITDKLKLTRKEIEKRYRLAIRDNESVTVYNKKQLEENGELLNYEVNVFYNFSTELVKNLGFRTLMTEGGKSGLTSIAFICDDDLRDERGEIKKDLMSKIDCFDFELSERYGGWYMKGINKQTPIRGKLLPDLDYLRKENLEFNRTSVLHKMRDIEELADSMKKDAILYKDLEQDYCSQVFQKDTLKGIELCFGYRDGNLNKPESLFLGDDAVHALMGGKTGSGKSVAINVVLTNLVRTYSPEWLELYMVDFKNVEFNSFTKTIETENFRKKLCYIPHASLIAGTTDPEYSLSVFRKALKEMERRKAVLSKGILWEGEYVTFKKIEDYNRFVLKHGIKQQHPIIPRILILLDEFQVMFQMEDDNILSQIKRYIARLAKEARSMGIHMFFTSQSMTGTVPEDIKAQFALRLCLSASVETSKEVLGNAASSRLPDKGFILSNQTMERKEEDNRKFKVPFIPADYILEAMEEVISTAKKMHEENNIIPFHNVEFYDEKDIHRETELKLYLNANAIKSRPNAFLLGPKVVFKEKSVPENFTLGTNDGENLLVTGNDRIATANLINTLMENINSKGNAKIMLVNFDRTYDGMFREDLVDSDFKHMINSTSIDEPLWFASSYFDAIRDGEEENWFKEVTITTKYDPSQKKIFIIFFGLHKSQEFASDWLDGNVEKAFYFLLKNGPSQGIHTILNYKAPLRVNKMLPYIAHRITAKIDEDMSFDLYNNRMAKNLAVEGKLHFGLYRSTLDDKIFKFKIYNFNYDKSLLEDNSLEDVKLA